MTWIKWQQVSWLTVAFFCLRGINKWHPNLRGEGTLLSSAVSPAIKWRGLGQSKTKSKSIIIPIKMILSSLEQGTGPFVTSRLIWKFQTFFLEKSIGGALLCEKKISLIFMKFKTLHAYGLTSLPIKFEQNSRPIFFDTEESPFEFLANWELKNQKMPGYGKN